MKKLFIGITTSKRKVKVNFLAQNITYVNDAFLDLIKTYDNIIPIFLSSDIDLKHIKEIIEKLDGLILTSGQDVDPSIYNAPNLIKYDEILTHSGTEYHRPHIIAPNKDRDLFEVNLYHAAKEKKIPILGICRGMQIINVAEGGTLHQELPKTNISHFLENDGWINYHSITISNNTKLFDIFKVNHYAVSSLHHQAIDKLGKNLIISAKAEDGIIEIIEHLEHDYIIGVQGHIEKIINNFPLYHELIKRFIESANKGALVT